MGILNQKLKKELQSIGVTSLPNHFKNVQHKSYESFQTNTRLTSYNIMLERNEVQPFVNSVKLRKKHPNALIQIQHAQVKKEEMQYCKILLFIEKVALNVQQVMLLNFKDMIGILYFSIEGFSQLFRFCGRYFTVQSYMIAINDKGQAKVWFNRDYSKHEPKSCYSYSKSGNKQEAEANMIRELKKLFFCKVQKASIPPNFALQALNFADLTLEIQKKFGNQLFVNNFERLITLKDTQSAQIYQNMQNSSESANSSVLVKQNTANPFIKFNYATTDKRHSMPRNHSMPLVQASEIATKSNYNISFNYSNIGEANNQINTSVFHRVS